MSSGVGHKVRRGEATPPTELRRRKGPLANAGHTSVRRWPNVSWSPSTATPFSRAYDAALAYCSPMVGMLGMLLIMRIDARCQNRGRAPTTCAPRTGGPPGGRHGGSGGEAAATLLPTPGRRRAAAHLPEVRKSSKASSYFLSNFLANRAVRAGAGSEGRRRPPAACMPGPGSARSGRVAPPCANPCAVPSAASGSSRARADIALAICFFL